MFLVDEQMCELIDDAYVLTYLNRRYLMMLLEIICSYKSYLPSNESFYILSSWH